MQCFVHTNCRVPLIPCKAARIAVRTQSSLGCKGHKRSRRSPAWEVAAITPGMTPIVPDVEEDGEWLEQEADWLEEDEDEEGAGWEDGEEDEEEEPPITDHLQVSQDQKASPSVEDAAKDAESRAFAVAMAKLGWETKAEDVTVLHVAPLVYWCSYMVILNIKSRPQLQAVIAKMERVAEEEFGRTIPSTAENSRGSEWEVLDFMDVVVQIFTQEQREHYNLDGYYSMAEAVELPFLKEEQQRLPWATKQL